MKETRTEDAVGHILCHDITQIIKDVKKGVLFKKGHIVREEDIPLLLSVGKEHLYVWEKKEGILHENEGAEILYKICAGDSDTMHGSDIKEGKIELYLWVKTPNGLSSWRFFEQMLYEANVVGTPGVGFGPSGEGYIRLTAFGERNDCIEAMRRIKNWL